ncbi:MAG TPA: RDD family protein [Candidatus Dormibacteraeota bacterium]|nr:RDD family protein [Candidatus Dormibacteraeota bacterium]
MGMAPDTLSVRTADNVSLGFSVAGLGSRMAAQMVDWLMVTALLLVAYTALSAVFRSSSELPVALIAGVYVAVFSIVVSGYFLLWELLMNGRTPGKNALGLRVMMLSGGAPDGTAILVRNIVRVVDLVVGPIVMFFHPLSRRLGDLAAGTVVVRERARLKLQTVAAPPPVFLRTPDAGPAIDGIERLGQTEHDALRTFLSRPGLTPELRTKLAGQFTSRLLERLELPESAPERLWPPELFLERLYLQLDQRLR